MRQDLSQVHQMSSHSPAQMQAQGSTPDSGTRPVQVPESQCAVTKLHSVASGVCVREGKGATLLGVACTRSLMGFGLSCKAVFLCPRGGEKVEVCFWLLKQWMEGFHGWKPDRGHSKASD